MGRKATNKFSKAARDSVFRSIIEPVIGSNRENILNAIDFIESPSGLDVRLYPIQRLLVRLMFGVPFDYKPEIPQWDCVPIWDGFRENVLYTFKTEADALKYLYEKGQCNIGDWRDAPGMGMPNGGYKEAAIFAGRRGGKSQVVSAIAAYKLYLLLSIYSPQDYYDLVEGSEIDFTFLAQDDDGATRLYQKLSADVNRAPFFSPFLRHNGASEMQFIASVDKERRDIKPSISVASFPCTTRAVRGPSSLFLALDEFAHFRATKDTDSGAIYESATPATIQFVPKEGPSEGQREAMVLCISSPLKRVGKMFELHKLAMDEGKASKILTLRVSTAEMNPRADSEYLKQQYKLNPVTWKCEYGGQFLDSSESFVKEAQLRLCVDVQYAENGDPKPETGRQNVTCFRMDSVGRQYFWGLDLGMKKDGTGLAIGHLEYRNDVGIELVYDYIDRMMVGEEFTGPGIPRSPFDKKYINYSELPLTDLVLWLVEMHKILPCFKGATDQHGGSVLTQLLQINGIQTMELVHLTPAINSQMFFALKGYIDNSRCRFPYVPKFLHEVKNVEADLINKYVLKVQAPLEKDSHDDMVDAAGLVAWLSMNYLDENKRLLMDPTGQSFAIQELAGKPPAIITDYDAITMRELQILERQRKIGLGFGGNYNMVPGEGQNPYFVRKAKRR